MSDLTEYQRPKLRLLSSQHSCVVDDRQVVGSVLFSAVLGKFTISIMLPIFVLAKGLSNRIILVPKGCFLVWKAFRVQDSHSW